MSSAQMSPYQIFFSTIYHASKKRSSTNAEQARFYDQHHRQRTCIYEKYLLQAFSLPNSMMHYITKKSCSPKCYIKLIHTCKYFFIKNSILVIPEMYFKYEENQWQIFCDQWLIGLSNLTCKIWITDILSVIKDKYSTANISSLLPKNYQSDVKELNLWRQTIFFDHFVFLALKCRKIILCCITVIDQSGTIVTLEKLVELLPYLTELEYYLGDNATDIITSETVQELLVIPHFLNLKHFKLFCPPETFDIQNFYTYLLKNKKTKVELAFWNLLSDAYEILLQNIVDEIIAAKNRDYKVPYIWFTGNDVTSSKISHDLYKQE